MHPDVTATCKESPLKTRFLHLPSLTPPPIYRQVPWISLLKQLSKRSIFLTSHHFLECPLAGLLSVKSRLKGSRGLFFSSISSVACSPTINYKSCFPVLPCLFSLGSILPPRALSTGQLPHYLPSQRLLYGCSLNKCLLPLGDICSMTTQNWAMFPSPFCLTPSTVSARCL
jgi:hypothetical protein